MSASLDTTLAPITLEAYIGDDQEAESCPMAGSRLQNPTDGVDMGPLSGIGYEKGNGS